MLKLILAIRNKRKFAKLYASSKTVENYELKKKYRNLVTKERRKAIREYWKKKSENLNESPRDFFNVFKPFLSNKTTMNNTISLKTEDEVVENNADIVANNFVDYFANISKTLVRPWILTFNL